MNMFRELRNNFSVPTSRKEIERAFVNRVTIYFESFRDETLMRNLSVILGKNYRDYIIATGLATIYKNPVAMVSDDPVGMMELLLAFRETVPTEKERIDQDIQSILGLTDSQLGIAYREGMFYPAGEELLDNQLIGESLSILKSYPNEDKDFRSALISYRQQDISGTISKSYVCLEGIAKKVLNNSKNLIANRADFIKTIGLDKYWGNIFHQYTEYANDYSRHANENRHDSDGIELEAFFYLTCLIIRLSVSKIN